MGCRAGGSSAFWRGYICCGLWCKCWTFKSGETIAAGGDGNTGWQDRVKNSIATVANDPALTFFLKKVHPTFIHQMPNLPKVISTTFKLRLIQFKQFIVI